MTSPPTVGVAPAHPLAQQDGSNLRAFHLYSGFFGRLSQGIETPLSRALLIARHQLFGLSLQPPRRRLSDQRDQPTALPLRQASGPSTTWSVTKSRDALSIKAVQATSYRL